MSLVKTFNDIDSAEQFSNKLREFGIPTYIGIAKGNNAHIYGGGPKAYGVWVLLESQHEDALKLIKGRKHKVANPLSEDEMVELEDVVRNNRQKKFRKIVIGFFTVLIITVVAISTLYLKNT